MFFEKLKSIKISPFWKKAFLSGGILAGSGTLVSGMMSQDNSVLNSNAQNRVEGLTPLERVQSLNYAPKIKEDSIADASTQELFNNLRPKIVQTKQKKEEINKEVNKEIEVVEEKERAEKKKEVASVSPSQNDVSCDPYDAALGKCELKSSHIEQTKAVAYAISEQTKDSLSDDNVGLPKIDVETVKDLPIPDAGKTKDSSSSPFALLVASSGETQVLGGRSIDIGGASHQIKSGTTVIAVLNESKTVTSSGEQYASASVIGSPFDREKFPDGVTVLLKLKLNSTQDGIDGTVVSCSSRRNRDKTIPCSGQLEDINGQTSLRGDVYSNAGWQIITTAASTFLAGLSLSKITTTATVLGTTVDQTTSNAVYEALSGAVTQMGEQIAASFARSGTQISIPGRVVVRILFTQDSVW